MVLRSNTLPGRLSFVIRGEPKLTTAWVSGHRNTSRCPNAAEFVKSSFFTLMRSSLTVCRCALVAREEMSCASHSPSERRKDASIKVLNLVCNITNEQLLKLLGGLCTAFACNGLVRATWKTRGHTLRSFSCLCKRFWLSGSKEGTTGWPEREGRSGEGWLRSVSESRSVSEQSPTTRKHGCRGCRLQMDSLEHWAPAE